MLVVVGLALSARPGTAALVYGTGDAVMRFGLELLRRDPVRPFACGLSEAQWFALLTIVICAVAHPAWWTIGGALVVACGAALLVARRRDRELLAPPHLREIDTPRSAWWGANTP